MERIIAPVSIVLLVIAQWSNLEQLSIKNFYEGSYEAC